MSEIINLGDFKFEQNHDEIVNSVETVDFTDSFLSQNLGRQFSWCFFLILAKTGFFNLKKKMYQIKKMKKK